jgi:transposase
MGAQVSGREFRCPKCGMEYDRDLNACINIAHALTRGMGWGAWLLNRQMRGGA